MRIIAAVICTTLLLIVASSVRADVLLMKDGSKIEGRVVPQGDQYWVKLSSGGSKMILKADVADWQHGASAASAGGDVLPIPASATGAFNDTKGKADRADAPLTAIGLWQNYIDNNSTAADLPAAKAELERWQKLDKDHAEKIGGKWVGGEERKKLIGRVNDLIREAHSMQGSETLKAVGKLEEAVRIYPNSFEANYELGFFNLEKAGAGSNQKFDQAIKSLETAAKLRPNSAACWSNLGIAYNFRGRYQDSVKACYKAAQLHDTKEIAQNLVNSIAQAPPAMRNTTQVRQVMEEASVLAHKYGISDGKQNWMFIPRRSEVSEKKDEERETIDAEAAPGVIGNGSGFLVSADGYLLTNRHVADEKGCTFICRMSDGTQKPAEVIAIDDDADLALMKIKSPKPLPYLKLAGTDVPGVGAECAALGFPVANLMHYTMQVTAGTVSSVSDSDKYPVTLTAKITHGNSGGPLVDKYGNVIGVVSAGLTAYTETYGKAISVGQVRKFLDKNKDKFPGKLEAAADKDRLDTEAIYKQASPATMCILLVRGDAKTGAD
jgi:S1-C subfamily serine protease